jgi:hypothetical protein
LFVKITAALNLPVAFALITKSKGCQLP